MRKSDCLWVADFIGGRIANLYEQALEAHIKSQKAAKQEKGNVVRQQQGIILMLKEEITFLYKLTDELNNEIPKVCVELQPNEFSNRVKRFNQHIEI